MMKTPSPAGSGLLATATLLLGLSPGLARVALAGPLDLPGGCAVAHASIQDDGSHLRADRLEVTLPAQPGAVFHAARLDASIHGAALATGALAPGALAHVATAAAAAVLVAVSGHREGACSDRQFQQAAAPLAGAIGAGGHVDLAWTGISVRSGDKRFGAQRLVLRLDGAGPDAKLSLALDGAVSNEPTAALLPETLRAVMSLPADGIPALLSAAGGHGAPVDVRIDSLSARRGATSLEGTGQARIAADPSDASGTAHLLVHDYDALLDAASAPGLERLRTALFLAKLVAHRDGDAAAWDLAWQGGTVLVNNVPLPLR